MKLSRSTIYDAVYPRATRMSQHQIKQAFWDFYALEFLRHLLKEKQNFFEVNRIESLLQTSARTLLIEQTKALEACVRGEIRYFLRACRAKNLTIFDACDDVCCQVSPFLAKVYKNETPLSLDLPTIADLFSKTVWKNENFGGKNWQKGTLILIKAKKAFENDELKDMILAIDSIFDLQHNNGFILDKTNFETLDRWDMLDDRFQIKTIKQFQRKPISPIVRKYIAGIETPTNKVRR